MYKLSDDKQIAKRQKMELAIVRKVVADALAAGYVLDVDDGGEELAVTGATTMKVAMDALWNTDEDYLILRWPESDPQTGRRWTRIVGWVRFVYGNDGWDAINDYSMNIEAVLAGANALAERLEERQ